MLLVLTHAEVEQLLPMEECISVMEHALAALAKGQVHMPLRTLVRPSDAAGLMGLMPGYMSGENPFYGLKAVCVFPQNTVVGKDPHQGSVMLFSGETGELQVLMNASAITAIRTAAVSGVATTLLARKDAGDLAIIGSGIQARSHLAAMACVRPIRRVRVASRNIRHAVRFAEDTRALYPFPIEAVDSVEKALRGADLIVTATNAREPILNREWIVNGSHLNVVGSSISTAREADSATMAASSLFVDRRESTINESGDYLYAMRDGSIGPAHIKAEIGEVLVGSKPGRVSQEEITLFKSLGLAVEDLASAEHVFRKAQEKQIGTWVEF